MKHIIISLITIALFLIMFNSCYYDNEEALYPALNSTCDTTNVTFRTTIVSILNNNCFTCHSNASAASWNTVRLENYNDVVAMSARIISSVKHTGSSPPMPRAGGMIKACSINQLDIWIKNKMPE